MLGNGSKKRHDYPNALVRSFGPDRRKVVIESSIPQKLMVASEDGLFEPGRDGVMASLASDMSQ